MADAVAAQIRGTPDFGGDLTSLYPLVLAGEAATTAHPMWTDAPFERDQTVAFELGGCRKRYNAGLARTAHIGALPTKVAETAVAVEEGMEAVLGALKGRCSRAATCMLPGSACWTATGSRRRAASAIRSGSATAPDWGEHTLSFRPGETVEVPENAVVHIILGMWLDGWGMELSETIHVRGADCVCLTDFPRAVHVVD